MTVADTVAAMLHVVETQPPSAYWWGFQQEQMKLAAHPDEAVSAIVPVLQHPNAEVRRYFARVLRTFAPREAVFRPLLTDADDDVVLEAVQVIRDVPALDRLLRSWKLYIFEQATVLLAAADPALLVTRLLARLPEPDWNFRSRIISALSKHAPTSVLVELTRHSDAQTRHDVCLSLSHLQTDEEVKAAILASLDDTDASVRRAAALAAGRQKLTQALPRILALAASDPSDTWSLTALGDMPDPRALPLLLARAPQQVEAVHALKKFGPREDSETALLAILASDADPYLKLGCAEALCEMGSARCVEALERFMKKDARRLAKRSRKEVFRIIPAAIERLRL